MSGATIQVRSLWVPLRDANILLPNVAVAEVGNYRVPHALEDAPDWMLGTVDWHGQSIPVISLESLCGENLPANLIHSRLMIVNSVRPDSAVQYYAIVTAGLPHSLEFDNSRVDDVEECGHDALQCRIFIGRQQAVIPDLDYIQAQVEQHWKAAA